MLPTRKKAADATPAPSQAAPMPFTPSAELQEATAALNTALDARARVDEALSRKRAEMAGLRSAVDAAEAEVQRLAVDRELAGDLDAEIAGTSRTAGQGAAHAGKLREARGVRDTAADSLTSGEALLRGLEDRARQADEGIEAARSHFDRVRHAQLRPLQEAIVAEYEAAAAALGVAFGRFQGLHNVLGVQSQMSRQDFTVPSLTNPRLPLMDGYTGFTTALPTDFPELLAVRAALNRLQRHREYKPPQPAAAPYVPVRVERGGLRPGFRDSEVSIIPGR